MPIAELIIIHAPRAYLQSNAMSDKPIIFSGPIVRAILEGTKTQTRRVVKVEAKNLVFDLVKAWKDGPQPFNTGEYLHVPFRHKDEDWSHGTSERVFCPYGQPGDRLWVKETWRTRREWNHLAPTRLPIKAKDGDGWNRDNYITYPAGGYASDSLEARTTELTGKLRPSIFMRQWMSRITLEITSVRVERLQDISEEDAIAEGCCGVACTHFGVPNFRWTWESLHDPGSWALNPWVWVIEFRRVES